MILGIDLGTTNSLSAIVNEDGQPEVLINERGRRLTPSAVYFKSPKEAIVGESAISASGINPENLILNIKRKMGTQYRANILKREFTPSEISSLILKKIKNYSEHYLNNSVEKAIITVPAYFNHMQRAATKRAAEIANLDVVKILNEPTAAALSYNLFKNGDDNILVLDLGGGTLDITLIEYKDKVQKVIGLGGNSHLGGVDFDKIIEQLVLDEFLKSNNIDLTNDLIALNQVRSVSQKAKEELSTLENTSIVIPYISFGEKGPVHLRAEVSREEFENLSKDIVSKIIEHIEETFERAGLTPSWVTKLIFVGGSSRIPIVRKKVIDYLREKGGKFELPETPVNPEEAVAVGAAIYGGMLEGKIKEIKFFDVISHYFGIEDDDGLFVPILEPNSTYPIEISKVFTTVSESREFIKVHILQSKDREGKDELVSLGYFFFEDISPDNQDIDIIFRVDEDGILKVKAMDLKEGSFKEIEIRDFYSNDEFKNEKRGKEIKVI